MEIPKDYIMSVTEFNQTVNDILSGLRVWVKGEVSGFKISQNKWVSFDLKDQGSRINCFMTVFGLDQVLEDGMEVKVYGNPRVYVPYGKYSFNVERVMPMGEGALKKAFELTKLKLEQEGLFAVERKKALPRFPQTIGIVTSSEAAAYTDFVQIVKNRWAGVELILRPSLVQGDDAPGQIVQALEFFNKYQPVDVIVLTRGGGSLEDLQAFNSEIVCRAIFASRIPIICGVGHERDLTLAELVADRRASTPSNAAEIAVPDKQEILYLLKHYSEKMEEVLRAEIAEKTWQTRTLLASLEKVLQRYHHYLADLSQRLQQSSTQFLLNRRQKLAYCLQILQSYNPKQVLKRGYSIVRQADGQVIQSIKQVQVQAVVQTEVADGVFLAQVSEKRKHLTKNLSFKF